MSNIFNTVAKNNTQVRFASNIVDEISHIDTAVIDKSLITNSIYSDKIFTYDSYGDMVQMIAGTGIPSNLYISKLVCDPNELTTTDMFSTIDEHGITVASSSGNTIISSDKITITNAVNESFELDNSRIQFLDSFNQIAEILPSQIKFNRDIASDISSINTNHDKLLLLEGITNDHSDDIQDLQTRLYGSGKSIVLGDGRATKISAGGYFTAFSNSKNITSCQGSGVFIDMDPLPKNLTLNNSIIIGKNNSSNTDSSDNVCYGINNVVPRTSVFVGLDNIANRGGQDTRYSVIVGSNNQINNRCFVFGRDNFNIGERNGGFTTPTFCLGSGNNYKSPKDHCMILGFDTNDIGTNPDSVSGCIIVGGGTRIYEPYCAYYGNNHTNKTFMAGIRGNGNILTIDNGTTEIIKSKDIVLYNDTNTASKVISFDYLNILEQNSNVAFSTYNNDPDFNRYNIVYNSTTDTYGRTTLPVVSRASVRITGPIDWNNIAALPITTSTKPIYCGQYGDSIIINSLLTTSEGADIPLNQTRYFTIAVKADANIGSTYIPCYKLHCVIKDQVYTSSSIAIPKFKESISEPIKVISDGEKYYMYVISIQNISEIPFEPYYINFYLEPFTYFNDTIVTFNTKLTLTSVTNF